MKRAFQPAPSSSEQPEGDRHISDQLVQVGDVLPARLLAPDMQRIFRISRARFYALAARGKFDRFELKPTIGRRAWSGALVMTYLRGEAGSSRFTLGKKGAA